jgi:hypothetical protein
VLVGAVAWLALAPGVARASEFVVSLPADAPDASVGDGKCISTSAGGGCTLRAAVQEADAASGSTVVVPAGRYRLSIPPKQEDLALGSATAVDGATGDLDINQMTTVRGAGAALTTIDGGGLDRVFAIANGGKAQLSDMTLTGGDPSHGGTSQYISLGGAVLNGGDVTLERLALINNLSDGGAGMFSIPGTSPVIRDSLIANNRAYSGAGLRLDAGATIINSTITGNRLMVVPDPSKTVTERPVPTLFAIAVDEGSGWGGGIDNRGGDDVDIVNSTITNNHAIKGGGGLATGQGYAPVSEHVALGRVTLRNTIIAANTSDAGTANCHVKDQVIASLGHNLDSDGTCFLTANGDRPKTDPRLGPLADNGGPTRTQALLPGSPAIDAGGADGCPKTDQRGIPRPQGAACDIGAFEACAAGAACSSACLSRRSPIGPRNIGRVRLGYTRGRLLRLPVTPPRRTRRAFQYCVKGAGGRVTAVFSSRSKRGKVRLVTTTARRHGNRGLGVGSRASRFRRAYPNRRLVTKGIYRARKGSRRLFGVRRGRVRFIAVADKGLARRPRSLRRYLRLAGLK